MKARADLSTVWSLYYGGGDNEEVNSMVLAENDGCIVAGMTESYGFGAFGKPDIWIVELDAIGTVIWDETYGVADSFETAYHLLETGDSGYLAAGYKCGQWGFGYGDAILLKIDSTGTEEWFRQFGGSEDDGLRFIQPSPAGGYIACGWTRSSGAGFVDAWVVKTDSIGNVEWDSPYGGTEYDVAKTVYPLPDGGYLVAGYTSSQGAGENDGWLFKIDADGVLLWEKVYGGTEYDRVYHSAPCSDGNFVLTGMLETGSEGYLWVFKVDIDGNVIWEKTYDKAGDDEGHYIEETSDQGFVIAAWAGYEGNPWTEMWIVRLNDMGEMLWDSAYGGSASDNANVVRQLDSTDYLLGGSTLSFGSGRVDMWVMKLHDNQTGIESSSSTAEGLFSCHPNPCVSSASFILNQQYDSPVSVKIYDHTGRLVLTAYQGYLQTGMHAIPFNVTGLSNGVYFAMVEAGASVQHEKIVLLR